MTWVKGTTTWLGLSQKIAQLVCGEVADDSAVTVASGDQWLRCYTRTVTDGVTNGTTTFISATGAFTAADKESALINSDFPLGTTIVSVTNSTTVVASQSATGTHVGLTTQIALDTIKTKASLDVSTGACSGRSGYYASASGMSVASALLGVCKVTNQFTSDPSTSGGHRWIVSLRVGTANTVSGNYSTAVLQWKVSDADSAADTTLSSNTNAIPSSGGLVTIASGHTVTVSDPSGFLTVGQQWVRSFTSAYMWGIDIWPWLSRVGGTAPTFSVAPSGVLGTDYDIVQLGCNSSGNNAGFLGQNNIGIGFRAWFYGLGIKSTTGNSGALYTASFSMALHKGRIFNANTVQAPGVAGTLGLDVGDARGDGLVGSFGCRPAGHRLQQFCKIFATAASVTNSAGVQYFLSVKSDGIFLVLNGDPGFTGKLAVTWFGSMASTETTYDVLPTSFSYYATDYTIDQTADVTLGAQFTYWAMRRYQDGSESPRDWQTKWMRCDGLNAGQTAGGVYNDNDSSSLVVLAPANFAVPANTGGYQPGREAKPSIDGKWWLYGYQYNEGSFNANGGLTVADEARHIRFTTTTRFLFIPGDGWASGDELTDSISGIKYLLLMPDYMHVGNRVRISASSFIGGLAVAEI